MTPHQRTEALMPALEFTWDDLTYNRAGLLSASQQERIGDLFKRQQFFSNFSLIFHAISIAILGALLAFYLVDNNFSFDNYWSSSYRIVLPLFIAMSISTLVVAYHYISHRQIIHATVRSVQGSITKKSAGIRPNASMMTDKVGIAANVTLVAGFVIRNLLGGRGVSARSKDYEIVTGYSIGVGGKEFQIIKRWGEPFQDGTVYTVYYIKNRAFSMMVAAEAVE